MRKTVEAIDRDFNMGITSKAVYDITKRVADKATPNYLDIRRKIRRANYLHIDETKIKIQGIWHYLWVFRSTKYVFFVIRRERNRNVLDEILGYHYRGIIICDGLSAYEEYTKYLQRCWAHILRETKEYAEKYDDAKPLHQWMYDLFKKVKAVSIRMPLRKRKNIYEKCEKEMEMLIQIYSSYSHLGEIITKVKNGLPYWFTRILHPRIEPTNNTIESINGLGTKLAQIAHSLKVIDHSIDDFGTNVVGFSNETRPLLEQGSGVQNNAQILDKLFEPFDLILIDEPEISQFPNGKIEMLRSIIKELDKKQIVIATHDPTLINQYLIKKFRGDKGYEVVIHSFCNDEFKKTDLKRKKFEMGLISF